MNWSDIVLSILTGFVGSLAVVIFMHRLRPNLEISGKIAEREDADERVYKFKLINRSSYAAIDVRLLLEIVTPSTVPGGVIYTSENIPLIVNSFMVIPRFSTKDKDADYAFRVRTKADLREIWTSDTQYLRLTIVAKHELSGFTGALQKKFYTKGDIEVGQHRFGNDLSVQ